MEQKSEILRYDSLAPVGTAQFTVRGEIPSEGAEKVLSATAEVVRTQAEALNGECTVSGKINFRLLCLANEEIVSLDYLSDFSVKVDGDVTPNAKLIVKTLVTNVNTQKTGDDVIEVTAEISCEIIGANVAEFSFVVGADEIACQTNDAPSYEFLTVASGTAQIFEEFADENVKTVYSVTATALPNDARCGENSVLISGTVFAEIFYKTENEIKKKTLSVPFAEELDAKGATLTSHATPYIAVDSSKIVMSGTENDTELRAEITISIFCPVFAEKTARVVVDAFSPTCDLALEKCNRNFTVLTNSFHAEERITAQAELNDALNEVYAVIGTVSVGNTIANKIPSDGGVTIEGIVATDVLYLDRENKINSVEVELPYSVFLKGEVEKSDVVEVTAVVTDVSAIAKRAREIEVTCIIKTFVNVGKSVKVEAVCKIEEKEQKQIDCHALSIHIGTEGETLWQVAKALNVMPDELQKSNSDIAFPLSGGEKIVNYRQLDIRG